MNTNWKNENMTTQHTPGPWDLEDHGYKYVISKPGEGYITRDVCRMDGSTMAAFDQKANARLIAAAPELLAALKELDAKPEHTNSWLKARAAIAKAEGRA